MPKEVSWFRIAQNNEVQNHLQIKKVQLADKTEVKKPIRYSKTSHLEMAIFKSQFCHIFFDC